MEQDFNNSFPQALSKADERYYLEKMHEGDKQAKEILITHNMRLVAHIAKKYFVLNENEDLVSIGYFGLVKGLETFKLDKNICLSTYLGRCIENEILMYLRKIKKQENCISLESAIGKDNTGKEFKLINILADESVESFVNATNTILNKDLIIRLLTCLNKLEKNVIILRFGLKDEITRSQKEVAQILGFSRSYISRIEKDAIEKMRNEIMDENSYKNSNNF